MGDPSMKHSLLMLNTAPTNYLRCDQLCGTIGLTGLAILIFVASGLYHYLNTRRLNQLIRQANEQADRDAVQELSNHTAQFYARQTQPQRLSNTSPVAPAPAPAPAPAHPMRLTSEDITSSESHQTSKDEILAPKHPSCHAI